MRMRRRQGLVALTQRRDLPRLRLRAARRIDGPGFHEYFGDSLSSIDNMADRSPEGELEIAGGCLRYLHNCNWKMFVENLNDTMHPMVVHESSAGTAKKLWEGKPADLPKPMADRAVRALRHRTTSSSTTWACASRRTATASPGVELLDPLQLLAIPGLRGADGARLW